MRDDFQNTYSAVYGTAAVDPADFALQVDAAGASPPRVSRRWMNVVFASRPPPFGAGVALPLSSSHAIELGSTVTEPESVPTILLPALVCHVGPPKCVMITRPRRSYRFARGPVKVHAVPLQA